MEQTTINLTNPFNDLSTGQPG